MSMSTSDTAPRALAGLVVEGDVIALTCPTRAAEVVLVEHEGIRVRWIVRDLATGADATVTRLWGKSVPLAATAEDERHDYEPGDGSHPMHTDPLCRICGKAKRDRIHR